MSETGTEHLHDHKQRKREKRDVHGWLVLDKPVGMTSTHAVSVVKRAVPGQARRPRRHARSARLRLPADRARRGDQDRAVRDGRPQDLSLHGALGRGARHRRRRRPRRGDEPGAADRGRHPRAAPAFHRHHRAGAAALLRREDRRRARLRPRARRRGGRARRHARSTSIGSSWSRRPTPDHAVLAAECGKGTYVRALARDMGRVLGCFGHVAALRRTAVGPFTEDIAVRLDRAAGGGASPESPAQRARPARRCCRSRPGVAALPALAVSRADAAPARPRPGGAAARPRCPLDAGLGRGLDAWRTDRARRGRAGRAASAAHLPIRPAALSPERIPNRDALGIPSSGACPFRKTGSRFSGTCA